MNLNTSVVTSSFPKFLSGCHFLYNRLIIFLLSSSGRVHAARIVLCRIERIHAFDLYKFNRNFQNTSNEIAPFIDIASNSSTDGRPLENILMELESTIRAAWTLPEDERRKIIKRLTVAYCLLYDTTALWQPVFYVSFLECTIQNVLVIIILLFLVIT
jgi:hypothetical protein